MNPAQRSIPLRQAIRVFARFLGFYLHISGWRLWVSMGLRFVHGATQGVGLVAVLPLLAALGYLPMTESPAMLQSLAETIRTTIPEPRLLIALVGLFSLIVLFECLRYLESRLHVRIEQDFLRRLRVDMLRDYLGAKWQHLSTVRESDVSHALLSEVAQVSSLARQSLNLILSAITTLCYLGAAFFIHPVFSLLVVLAGLPLVWMQHRRSNLFKAAGRTQRERTRQFHALLLGSTQGLKLVKSLNLESSICRNASELTEEMKNAVIDLNHLSAVSKWMHQVGSIALILTVLWLGLEPLGVDPAVMLLLTLIFARLYPRISGLQQSWQNILPGLVSFRAYRTTIEQLKKHAEHQSVPDGKHIDIRFEHALRLQQVSFSYDGKQQALKGISLSLHPRETVALVGASGAGKTTLGDILLGLLEPTSGRIELDGSPLSGEALTGWRQRVAYVPQETYLFHESIAWNLRWSCPEASEDDIWKVLQQAAAADFVRQLSEGIHTVVGNRGHRLSGGERQRIALARALLRKPLFLLLDEATSALDTENERLVQQAIRGLRQQLCVCVIAHRMSTIRHADRIIVLEKGQIASEGSWETLLAENRWFTRAVQGSQSDEV